MFYDFFLKNAIIFIAIFIVFFILFFLEFFYFRRLRNSINVFDLVRLVNHENAILLDFRIELDYKKGHILNSLNIPFNDIDKYVESIKKYKKKKIIVIFSSNYASLKVIKKLTKFVNNDLYFLDGGFSSWLKEDMPVKSL